MSFSISNIFGIHTASTPVPVTPMGAPAPTTGYRPDAFMMTTPMTTTVPAIKLPVNTIVDDAGAASRYNFCFIKTSDALLTVGGNGGSFGRFFLNLLAGAVPLFTPAARREEISNNVMAWVGRADLVRSGCSPSDARMLQAAGIANISDLARMGNPMDQMTLLGRIQMAAMQYGGTVPAPASLAAWVATAQTLPPRIK